MSDNHSTAVAIVEHHDIDRLHPLVRAAMASGGQLDPQTLREFMALQREWEAGEAKRAFTRALVDVKRELPAVIARDHQVDFTGAKGRVAYRHATLAHVLDEITEPLARHGFALTWASATEANTVRVTCKLTHALGHAEELTLAGPPDTSGGKNAIQQIGSTITYLQRYSALSLLGIATADMDEPTGEPTVQQVDAVDAERNLRVVAKLRDKGKTAAQAEEHVGRPVKDWTSSDIDKLRSWVAGPGVA